ncbi:MAG: tRNA pseudouridine(38-40) synthase TruA [Deltaproteobacteria bacterium]|nr:MAG: tRNA pseudouridine(38-40) synthase TruA [Deltaproteobacteria bacterium]
MVNNREERNIKLIIAYDGTGYFGWQRQNDKPTIQGMIEQKIGLMVGKPVSLIGAGRTDAGVHALYQVANFRVSSRLTPPIFLNGLNSLLPDDIIIKEAEYVPFDFHARYSAKSKVYEYRIHNQKLGSPFLRHYAWHIPRLLDLKAMEECLEIIKGPHDFSHFCTAGDRKADPVRNMIQADLEVQKGNLLVFNFEANGFLRHMVRNIMGTIVKVGLGEISTGSLSEVLESRDRRHPGAKAPPGGLYLKDVRY